MDESLEYFVGLSDVKNKKEYEEIIKDIVADGKSKEMLLCSVDWKDTADNYGHRAGDEAIFAVSLALSKSNLGKEIYRISHNRFIVLGLYDDFQKRINDFYNTIEQWRGIFAPSSSASIKILNTISICDECGSEYITSTSVMLDLCPECASILYGYKNCDHTFKNRKCIKCHWDGSRSDYIKKLLSQQ